MINNYFKIAVRNLKKYRLTSFINLFGLTVGFTCCLLILIYILNELSYDRFNHNANRIYRVTRSFNTPDGKQNLHLSSLAPPFGPRLKNDFPDIKKVTRILSNGPTAFRYHEKILNEHDVFYADNDFFDFFSVPLLKGNRTKALEDPQSLVMDEETAKKYFGEEDPMNKLVRIDSRNYLKVTGIFKPFPANSHIRPQILLSFNALKDSAVYGERQLETNWANNSFFTYILLPGNYPVKQLEKQFPAFIDKNMPPARTAGAKPSQFTKLHLQKLTDIHLYSNLDNEIEPNGDIHRVYIFSSIALFILLIACINYMNLSTARSVLRAREIGIRKTIGASRREIIVQFLSESVLMTLISVALSILITALMLPYISKLSGRQLSLSGLIDFKMFILILIMPFITGLFSGLYPALFLSAFEPVRVLKGILKINSDRFSFRKVLVVVQFSVSIVLIIATIVVFRQLKYMQNTNLGFNKDHVITTPYNSGLTEHYEQFKNELLSKGLVNNVSRSSRIPTGKLLDDLGAISTLQQDSMRVIANANVKFVSVDYSYIPTFGIEMAAGRNFSNNFSSDSNNFVLNTTAAAILGWKDPRSAVGKGIRYGGISGKIIGVVTDFHFESMHKEIVPLLLGISRKSFYNLSFKINGKHIPAALTQVESLWHSRLPDVPFEFSFLDEDLADLYRSESQQSTIFTLFSCIAVFIACLGLFGLSAFTISQRIKEIGIRKLLGATVPELIELVSKDFIRLVLISAVLAFPIAWYVMTRWLQDFAYRIQIPWWTFALSAFMAVMIAFLTISGQAIKAARANPVKNLRTE